MLSSEAERPQTSSAGSGVWCLPALLDCPPLWPPRVHPVRFLLGWETCRHIRKTELGAPLHVPLPFLSSCPSSQLGAKDGGPTSPSLYEVLYETLFHRILTLIFLGGLFFS